jgi:aspartyl-tRNA(Asn)/glutamyl-tRNA(Gln) amidotransferase subunit A
MDIHKLTIEAYGRLLRSGELTAEQAVTALLARIDELNPKLGAFTHVARETALSAARGTDALLAGGTDLGPLMGVPVAVKDLYYVEGMPTTAGSRGDVSGIVSAEGSFVQALRRSGCVILGKTWTSEFALGGINFVQRVPWNPCDEKVHRTPGGSSGGSAVAMAAGLCLFSVGSDTGGSVRLPAALCGVFGHKFSSTAFALDGIFPLSPTLDSIGVFTSGARDARLIWRTLKEVPDVRTPSLAGLRLAMPRPVFYDDPDREVKEGIDRALARLKRAGAQVYALDVPQVSEFEPVFGGIVPIELVGILGRERTLKNMERFDPVVQSRLAPALDYKTVDYIAARRRQVELRDSVLKAMGDCDAWVTPTTPLVPTPLADYAELDKALAWNRRALRNTRPGNIFDQCGVSVPLTDTALPVGLQLLCAGGDDTRLLAIAAAVETALAGN